MGGGGVEGEGDASLWPRLIDGLLLVLCFHAVPDRCRHLRAARLSSPETLSMKGGVAHIRVRF